MNLDWQDLPPCTDNVQEYKPSYGCSNRYLVTCRHQYMPIIDRGDVVMSASDYLRVHNTRLADMNALPRELLCRYLATCPDVVRNRLLSRLVQH